MDYFVQSFLCDLDLDHWEIDDMEVRKSSNFLLGFVYLPLWAFDMVDIYYYHIATHHQVVSLVNHLFQDLDFEERELEL